MLKRNLTIILVGYIIGIIMELYFKKGIALLVLLLFLSILIIKHVKFCPKSFLRPKTFKDINRVIQYLKHVLTFKIICIFMISFFISMYYTKYLNYKYDNLYLGLKEGYFLGIIQSEPEKKEYTTKYKIKINSINQNLKYKNTYLYLLVENSIEKFEYGDLIFFKGEYIEPEVQKNFGGFSYKEYLKTLKICGTVNCTESTVKIYEKNNANIISLKMNELANSLKDNTYKLLSSKEANLLIGILIGDTTKIDEKTQNNFRDSSLIHILAVSGSHVNYIILSLIYVNNKINLSKKILKIITIIVLLLFMFLVGFSPSVVRAVIMGISIMVAQIFYKKLDIINSISFSALILLLINPFNIINVGFLLSYGGTIGIVSLSSNINNIFAKKHSEKKLIIQKRYYAKKITESIKEMLVVTISAQIIIMPIIWYMFNTVSLTFFISNLIASPLMGLVTILGFITIFISFISIPIAKVLAFPLNISIKFLILIADFFRKHENIKNIRNNNSYSIYSLLLYNCLFNKILL